MKFSTFLSCSFLGSLWIINGIFVVEAQENFATVAPGDCALVREEYGKNGSFTIIDNLRKNTPINHETIIDKASLNGAFLNLKKVCCEHLGFKNTNALSCKNDAPYFQTNVPQSYALFDHLLDVLVRRLNGMDNSGIEKYIYDNMTLDEKGEERRKRIDETMEKVEGTTPMIINNKYVSFRTIDPNRYLEGMVQDASKSQQRYINDMTTGRNLTLLNEYPSRTLGERYANICNIARYMYALFDVDGQSIITTKARLLDTTFLKNNNCEAYTNACTCLIEKRIENETTYVKDISRKKSDTLLTNNVKEFANSYLFGRLMEVQTTSQKIKTYLTRVVRSSAEIVPQCT